MDYLSNLTGFDVISCYFILGVIHGICMLRVSGGAGNKTEAFWLVFMLTIVFPIVAAYSVYWIVSNLLFFAVGNQKVIDADNYRAKVLADFKEDQEVFATKGKVTDEVT